MRRREFIGALLGGAAAAGPLAARAQAPTLPVIGFMRSTSAEDSAFMVAAFRRGLGETGYVEGQNVAIEYRWAEGHYDRLPALAADLVRSRVAVIVATGGTPSVVAAKQATATIPIVFTTAADPVQVGFVASLSRPGGNLTGATIYSAVLGPKRIELLHELVPKAKVVGLLVNPANPPSELQSIDAREATRALGLRLEIVRASSEPEIEAAFAILARQRIPALAVSTDPIFERAHDKIVALAARYALPAAYAFREYVIAGGLISYGANIADTYRQVGIYAGRILKGAKPADLPVVLPTKFELVINLKTARALGLAVPPALIARADEVIE